MSEAEWDAWDKQIEEDLKAGRLDKLIGEAEDDYRNGLTLPICEGKRKFYRSQVVKRLNDSKQ